MFSKLATIVFLTLMAISWTTTATAAEHTEAQVHQLNEAIQKLEHALERATTAAKKLELKGALQEYRQKLEELMAGSDEAREFEGEFSEIEMAIRNTRGQLKELKHAAEILGDEGGEPEKLEKLQQQIARKEAQLEELTAHFERRERGEEREHEGREGQIRQVKGAIQELRHALEHRPDSEKVEQWRASLMEYEQHLEWLTAEHDEGREHRGEFPEIEMAIERARGQLKELAHAAEDLQETGSVPDKLESIRKRINQKERELEELFGLRERRRQEAAQRGKRPPGELVIFRLKHTEAGDLGGVIEKFLTSSGTIAAHHPSNSLVIRDTRAGLEAANKIIRELDIPRERERDRRREPRNRRAQEGAIVGKVLEAGKEGIIIGTEEGQVHLYVPRRRREDGTRTLMKELSIVTARQKVGSTIKVFWRRGEDRLWITRFGEVEREKSR